MCIRVRRHTLTDDVTISAATDGDTGSDQALRYRIESSEDVPFSIDPVEGWFSVRCEHSGNIYC